MKAVLRKKNLLYIFEQETINEGDYYLNKDLGIDRELFSIGRTGFKLIKTNDPSFATVSGLEGEYEELIKRYPEGLTQESDKPERLKERIDQLRSTIEGLIEEEQGVAREFEPIIDELLKEGNKAKAYLLSEQVFANHKIFLTYFKRKIEKFEESELFYGVEEKERLVEGTPIVRCNNCFRYFYESLGDKHDPTQLQLLHDEDDTEKEHPYKGCGNCKTDDYLIDIN